MFYTGHYRRGYY